MGEGHGSVGKGDGIQSTFWKEGISFLSFGSCSELKNKPPDKEKPPSTGRTFSKELGGGWCQQHVLHSGQRNGAVWNGSINNGVTGAPESWNVQRGPGGEAVDPGWVLALEGAQSCVWAVAPMDTMACCGHRGTHLKDRQATESLSSFTQSLLGAPCFQWSDPHHACAAGLADHVGSLNPDIRDLALLGCQIAQCLSC